MHINTSVVVSTVRIVCHLLRSCFQFNEFPWFYDHYYLHLACCFFVWFPIFWLWYRCAWLHVQVVWCFLIYVTTKHCQSKVKSCRNLVMWKEETCLNNTNTTTMLMYACSTTFWVHSFIFFFQNMEMFCDFGSREKGERVKQKITSPNILTFAHKHAHNEKTIKK